MPQFQAPEARDVPIVAYEDLVARADLGAAVEEAFGYDGMGILVVSGVPGLNPKRDDLLPLAFKFANLPDEVKDKYSLAKAYYSFGWSHGKENLQGKPDFSKGSYYNNPETNDVTGGNQELIDKFPAFYHPNIWPEGSLTRLASIVSRLVISNLSNAPRHRRDPGARVGLYDARTAHCRHWTAHRPAVRLAR